MYCYRRIIYERITKEALYEDYDIKNTILVSKEEPKENFASNKKEEASKRACSVAMRECNIIIEETEERIIEDIKKARSNLAKVSKSNVGHSSKIQRKYCWDEMDITSIAYSRKGKRLRLLITPTRETHEVYNPYEEQAEDILYSLISTLYMEEKFY